MGSGHQLTLFSPTTSLHVLPSFPICSCGVPSVNGLSCPAGLPRLRFFFFFFFSPSDARWWSVGFFVGCRCSHICVLPCTLCPLFCCCLYILYVIASLYICNCLCLCTFFLCFSFVLAPYTDITVFVYTPLHVVCTYCM